MKKRFLAGLLALCLALTMASVTALAEDPGSQVSDDAAPSQLLFRSMSYDSANQYWYEDNKTPLQALSSLQPFVGSRHRVQLYYGAADSAQPVEVTQLSSNNTAVLDFYTEPATDKQPTAFLVIGGFAVGTATLSYGDCSVELTVTAERPSGGNTGSDNTGGGNTGGGNSGGGNTPAPPFGVAPDDQQRGNALYQGDLVIGFARELAGGDVIIVSEGDSFYNRGTGQPNPSNPYAFCWDFKIAAANKTTSSGTIVYELDSDVTSSLRINEIRLVHLSGDQETFSWAAGQEQVLTKTDVEGSTFQVYSKEGYACEAMVYADVTYTVGGNEHNGTISISLSLMRGGVVNERLSPDINTVEKLEDYLDSWAEQANPAVIIVYHFYLPGIAYEGTLTIPDSFPENSRLYFYGATGVDGTGFPLMTSFKGGINMNGNFADRIQDIHFAAPESATGETKALYGGDTRELTNCSFVGYDVAIDCDDQPPVSRASGNVFVNNTVAVRTVPREQEWSFNTFIKNGTAVQVKTVTKDPAPYYFRIYDSNFIGNKYDFDVQCRGNFYMYRNYFGNVHSQAVSTANTEINAYIKALLAAKTDQTVQQLTTSNSVNSVKHPGTKQHIYTNPRSNYIINWWRSGTSVDAVFETATPTPTLLAEGSYERLLTVDWSLPAQVLNEDADELIIHESSFGKDAKNKSITVVEGEEETLLGTWTFD